MKQNSRINVLGVPIDEITQEAVIESFAKHVDSKTEKTLHLSTVNTEFVMTAQEDDQFKKILNQTDLNVPDGIGIIWAMKRKGSQIKKRVTGIDLMHATCKYASEKGLSIFLLGAAPGVAEVAAQKLIKKYNGLKVAGTYSGSPKEEEARHIVSLINESGADILFIAFSAPAPDKWLQKHKGELNVRIAYGVGGSFDFVAGLVKRAPKLFQELGLEWLYRLLQEPKRIKRQLTIPKFLMKVQRDR